VGGPSKAPTKRGEQSMNLKNHTNCPMIYVAFTQEDHAQCQSSWITNLEEYRGKFQNERAIILVGNSGNQAEILDAIKWVRENYEHLFQNHGYEFQFLSFEAQKLACEILWANFPPPALDAEVLSKPYAKYAWLPIWTSTYFSCRIEDPFYIYGFVLDYAEWDAHYKNLYPKYKGLNKDQNTSIRLYLSDEDDTQFEIDGNNKNRAIFEEVFDSFKYGITQNTDLEYYREYIESF
jgi:hypothetical protein